MERPCKDDYYLQIAKDVAMRSTCLRRNYGAVIVNHDRIVSTGYNGAPRGEENCCDRGTCPRMANNVPHNSGTYSDCCSVHAEQNAIIHATFTDMQGATLYLYGVNPANGEPIMDISPCPICSRMIKNAGISRVVVPLTQKDNNDQPVQNIEEHISIKERIRLRLLNIESNLKPGAPISIFEYFSGGILQRLSDSSTIDEARTAVDIVYDELIHDYPSLCEFLGIARINIDAVLRNENEEEKK